MFHIALHAIHVLVIRWTLVFHSCFVTSSCFVTCSGGRFILVVLRIGSAFGPLSAAFCGSTGVA
jgi:hypothetical protein